MRRTCRGAFSDRAVQSVAETMVLRVHTVTLFVDAVRAMKQGVGVTAALVSDGQNMKCAVSPYTPVPRTDLLENALVEGLRFLRRPCLVRVVCSSPHASHAVRRARRAQPSARSNRPSTQELSRLLGRHQVTVKLARSAPHREVLAACHSFIEEELRLTSARGRLPTLQAWPWPLRPQHAPHPPNRDVTVRIHWPIRFSSRRPGLQRVGEFIGEVRRILGLDTSHRPLPRD